MPNRMTTQMVIYSQEHISVLENALAVGKMCELLRWIHFKATTNKRCQYPLLSNEQNVNKTNRTKHGNSDTGTHFFHLESFFSLWFAFSCLFVYLVTNHKWIFQANIRIYEVSYLRIQIWCSVLSSHVQTIWKLALFTHCYYYFFLSRWNKRKTEFLAKLNMLFNDTTEDILLVKINTKTIFDDVFYLLGMNKKQTIRRKKIKKC